MIERLKRAIERGHQPLIFWHSCCRKHCSRMFRIPPCAHSAGRGSPWPAKDQCSDRLFPPAIDPLAHAFLQASTLPASRHTCRSTHLSVHTRPETFARLGHPLQVLPSQQYCRYPLTRQEVLRVRRCFFRRCIRRRLDHSGNGTSCSALLCVCAVGSQLPLVSPSSPADALSMRCDIPRPVPCIWAVFQVFSTSSSISGIGVTGLLMFAASTCTRLRSHCGLLSTVGVAVKPAGFPSRLCSSTSGSVVLCIRGAPAALCASSSRSNGFFPSSLRS